MDRLRTARTIRRARRAASGPLVFREDGQIELPQSEGPQNPVAPVPPAASTRRVLFDPSGSSVSAETVTVASPQVPGSVHPRRSFPETQSFGWLPYRREPESRRRRHAGNCRRCFPPRRRLESLGVFTARWKGAQHLRDTSSSAACGALSTQSQTKVICVCSNCASKQESRPVLTTSATVSCPVIAGRCSQATRRGRPYHPHTQGKLVWRPPR